MRYTLTSTDFTSPTDTPYSTEPLSGTSASVASTTLATMVETIDRIHYTFYGDTNYTPVDSQRLANELSWFPTRWEINRRAAIAGGKAQQQKHRRPPIKALVLRSSFQGMARLPCYRGKRTR